MGYVVEPVFTVERTPPKLGDIAPSGSPGMYHVTFPLAVPGRGVVQDQVNFAELIDSGDSLLEVGADVHTLRVDIVDSSTGKTYTATAHVNAEHRLRDIELEFHAENFANAEERAHNIVSPLLSRWSFLHDISITTAGIQIVERSTQIHRWQLTIVGMVKAFSDGQGVSDEQHRMLLSAYREAISSTEPMWQALCL